MTLRTNGAVLVAFLAAACGPGSDGPPSSSQGVALSISPAQVELAPRAQQVFSDAVTGSVNTAVTWTVEEGSGGGTVTAAGLYTAPVTVGTYHVVVTSQADTTKTATATVTATAAAPSSREVWVWIGNNAIYPWGCSAAAGCSGDEVATGTHATTYADIRLHTAPVAAASSFTGVSITTYDLNYNYASGRPYYITCPNTDGMTCTGPDTTNVLDGNQATPARLVTTYHGLGLKVAALMFAGAANPPGASTDQGISNVICGGSTAAGGSVIDPTLAGVCSAQRNFINAMVAEAQTIGFDGFDLDWEIGSLGHTYAQAMNNFFMNFRSALTAGGISPSFRIWVDTLESNMHGSYCSGNNGIFDPAILLNASTGALATGALSYLVSENYETTYSMGSGGASGYPATSCGTSPNWASNYYGSDVLNPSNPASCEETTVGLLLDFCPPNWGATLAIDDQHVAHGLGAWSGGSNPDAGQAMQLIYQSGFHKIYVWPDPSDGSGQPFMSTAKLNTSGFTLGGSDWYSMLANFLAAP